MRYFLQFRRPLYVPSPLLSFSYAYSGRKRLVIPAGKWWPLVAEHEVLMPRGQPQLSELRYTYNPTNCRCFEAIAQLAWRNKDLLPHIIIYLCPVIRLSFPFFFSIMVSWIFIVHGTYDWRWMLSFYDANQRSFVTKPILSEYFLCHLPPSLNQSSKRVKRERKKRKRETIFFFLSFWLS